MVGYSPTEKYPIENIESFYETVETALDYMQSKNIILLGDFNTKVGEIKKVKIQYLENTHTEKEAHMDRD